MGVQEDIVKNMLQSSHLSAGNLDYVESMYEGWLEDPSSVPEEWRRYFESLPQVSEGVAEVPLSRLEDRFRGLPRRGVVYAADTGESRLPGSLAHEQKQVSVVQLISSYRVRGHQQARLDPLGLMHREDVPDLRLEFHDLSRSDYDTVFSTQPLFIPQKAAKLSDIVSTLEDIYCGSIGYEFMAIVNIEEKQWIQSRIEGTGGRPNFSNETRLHILERLSAAEGLEKHLDSKYPGTKRFGLEGGESLIHALDDIIQRAGSGGTREIVIGMAHRGRLNVLVNTLGKNPSVLFDEFEGRALYKG